MSHENSITIQNAAGKWVNIPTVLGGKQRSEREAVRAYNEGRIGPLGGQHFDSMEEAVSAAKARSKNYKSNARVPR